MSGNCEHFTFSFQNLPLEALICYNEYNILPILNQRINLITYMNNLYKRKLL